MVEFGGFLSAPWIRVGGDTYGLGESLRGRHGFDPSAVLDDRLLRILVTLAVRRASRAVAEDAWLSAEQLAVTAESFTPDEVTSAAATRKFLERALCGYTRSLRWELGLTDIPNTHLIQYWPVQKVGTVLAHGRSRGPYRLGVPREGIRLDATDALEFLGHTGIVMPEEEWHLPDAIVYAETLAQCCDYRMARAALIKGLLRGAEHANEKQRLGMAGDAYHLLGQYAVQLRLPEDAIRAARRARALFNELRHPAGVVSTLLTEAHARGQLGNEGEALDVVRRGRMVLDDAAPRYRKVKRAECAGVAGQRHSHLHNFSAADRHLIRALHFAQEVDDRRQVCLWTVRRAENFLRQQNFPATEHALTEAHELFKRLAIAGMEQTVLWRVTASFAHATGQLDEAVRWTTRAKEFALAHGLDSQVDQLTSLVTTIDRPIPESAA